MWISPITQFSSFRPGNPSACGRVLLCEHHAGGRGDHALRRDHGQVSPDRSLGSVRECAGADGCADGYVREYESHHRESVRACDYAREHDRAHANVRPYRPSFTLLCRSAYLLPFRRFSVGQRALAVGRTQHTIDGIRRAFGRLMEVPDLQLSQQSEGDQLHARHDQHCGKDQ